MGISKRVHVIILGAVFATLATLVFMGMVAGAEVYLMGMVLGATIVMGCRVGRNIEVNRQTGKVFRELNLAYKNDVEGRKMLRAKLEQIQLRVGEDDMKKFSFVVHIIQLGTNMSLHWENLSGLVESVGNVLTIANLAPSQMPVQFGKLLKEAMEVSGRETFNEAAKGAAKKGVKETAKEVTNATLAYGGLAIGVNAISLIADSFNFATMIMKEPKLAQELDNIADQLEAQFQLQGK